MGRAQTILVVCSRWEDRDRMAAWLEEAGFEVMTCPGPIGPDACLGLRGPRCPLASAADAVILDMGAEDEPLGDIVPGWQLLNAYLDIGKDVVALTEPGDALFAEGRGHLIALRRPAERVDLLAAVAGALSAHAGHSLR